MKEMRLWIEFMMNILNQANGQWRYLQFNKFSIIEIISERAVKPFFYYIWKIWLYSPNKTLKIRWVLTIWQMLIENLSDILSSIASMRTKLKLNYKT